MSYPFVCDRWIGQLRCLVHFVDKLPEPQFCYLLANKRVAKAITVNQNLYDTNMGITTIFKSIRTINKTMMTASIFKIFLVLLLIKDQFVKQIR